MMKGVVKFLKIIFISVTLLMILVCLFFGYRDRPLDELKARYAGSPSVFIKVDGMDVHYRDEGDRQDTLPLVLLHGTASSLHTFDAWATDLKKVKRIVRMDMPGFGLTGPFPDRHYRINDYVDFLAHFLVAKGINKCILAGNSLGGEIAFQFTLTYPERVERLILIDAAGYPINSKSVPIVFTFARIPVLNKFMTFVTPRFIVKGSLENVYADPSKVTASLIDRYFELSLRAGNRQAFIDRINSGYDTGSLVQIKNIQQPTLLIWGEQDLLIPISNAYRFHHDLPNDTLVIIKNTGHVPMEESPTESMEAVMAFLKKR